jgi:hypothetical protein
MAEIKILIYLLLIWLSYPKTVKRPPNIKDLQAIYQTLGGRADDPPNEKPRHGRQTDGRGEFQKRSVTHHSSKLLRCASDKLAT